MTAGSVAVEAVMPQDASNTFESRALAGAIAKGNGIGGSISVNYLDLDTNATVGPNARLTANAGNIDVAAQSHNDIQNIAGGAGISTGSDTGVGVAIAVNIVNGLDTNASIGHDAEATASGSISVTADANLLPMEFEIPVVGPIAVTSFAAGIAASGSGSAVGGSSSVNVFFIDTHASVGDDATLLAGQNITVSATDELTVLSAAGGLAVSGGGSGVGIGLDVGVIERSTTAWVGEGADLTATAGDITINADSADNITSIAATFGVGGSSVAVAASIGVQVLLMETRAYTEDTPTGAGGTLKSGGILSVTANGDLDALLIAGSVGVGSSAGIGVASTVLFHRDNVQARVGERAVVTAGGSSGVAVTAKSTEEIIAVTAAGAAAGTAGVAVAPTVNVLEETTRASIGRNADITAQSALPLAQPDLSVIASDHTTIVSVAGSIGVGGTAGVGLGVDVLTLTKDTSAYIDSGVTADVEGDIDVGAASSEDVTSVAAGVAIGGSAGVGVNAGVHVLNVTTRAFIGDDPSDSIISAGAGDVHAGGTVRITADDSTEMDKVAATAAAGTVGVGAAATVTVVNKKTQAFIGAGASVTGDGNTGGLKAATGAFGVSFVADAPTPTATFSAVGRREYHSDTIDVGSTPRRLQTGDLVTYRKGLPVSDSEPANIEVGGLDSSTTYYVRVDGSQASLYRTKANAMAGDVTFDPAGAVDTTNASIRLAVGHGLATGDQITYRRDGADTGFGLGNGSTYYVNVDGDDVKFYNTAANAKADDELDRVALTGSATGTSHKLVTRIDLTATGSWPHPDP